MMLEKGKARELAEGRYTYRFQDEKSDKFWVIQVLGDAYAVHYGRTDTLGRREIREFDSPEECRRQAAKQVAAKEKKGYSVDAAFPFGEQLYFDTEEFGPHPLTSHPRFGVHFSAEFYYDCADEEAPFGSDEGADALRELEEYIKKNREVDVDKFPQRLVAQTWGMPFYPPDSVEEADVRELLARPKETLSMFQYLLISDQVVVAVAFGQIKIMGKVCRRLRDMARRSLQRIQVAACLEGYGPGAYVEQMLRDLDSFACEEAVEPSDNCRALMAYLDCPCTVFRDLLDDDDMVYAYEQALAEGREKGYTPLLVVVDDTLMEQLELDGAGEGGAWDVESIRDHRRVMMAEAEKLDGRLVLRELAEELLEHGEPEPVGAVKGGEALERFTSFWDYNTRRTNEVILALLPTQNPWELPLYVPMGGFNDCPSPPRQAAVMKVWYEQYGAQPGLVTYDVWEFLLPGPVEDEARAVALAKEHFAFCTDRVWQAGEGYTVGRLADSLKKSHVWYFWWD